VLFHERKCPSWNICFSSTGAHAGITLTASAGAATVTRAVHAVACRPDLPATGPRNAGGVSPVSPIRAGTGAEIAGVTLCAAVAAETACIIAVTVSIELTASIDATIAGTTGA